MKQEAQPQRVEQFPCTLGSALEIFQYPCERGVCPAFHFSYSLYCKTWIHLPCVFVVMISMTTHGKSLTRVQKELWYFVNDEDMKIILEIIIEKMNEVGNNSKRLKKLYDNARTFIPDNPKYEEKYWVAAYILHRNRAKLKNLLDELRSITYEIKKLYQYLDDLDKMSKKRRIKYLEFEYMYDMSLENLYELQHSKKTLLEHIVRIVKNLIV